MPANAAGNVNINLSMNAVTFTQGIKQAQAELDKFSGKAKTAGHTTVSGMQAASASMRLLENPMGNNIRAMERLVSQSKVLSEVMKAAFPLVGGIAIGVMLVKLGKDVYDFVDKVNKMPKAIQEGFASLHLASVSSTDALKLTNAELENSIAKLQGKPQNNLAIALAESRVKADELGKSLEDDAKKVKELLTANNISGLAAVLGKASTASVSGSVNSYQDKLRDLGYTRGDLVHSGDQSKDPALKAKIDAIDRETIAVQSSYNAFLKDQIYVRTNKASVYPSATSASGGGVVYNGKTYQDMAGDQKGNLNILHGAQQVQYDSADKQATQNTNATDVATNKRLEAQKAAAEQAKQAQAAAAKAQREQFEENLAATKNDHMVSTAEEYTYWAGLIKPAQKYPENYKMVLSHLGELNQSMDKQMDEMLAKMDEATKRAAEKQKQMDAVLNRVADEADKQDRRAADYTAALTEAQTKNASAMSEMKTAHDVATGSITKYDAAVQQATAHAAVYQAQLDALKAEKVADDSDSGMSQDQRDANQLQRNVKETNIQGEADRTAQDDQWKAFSETGLGGATTALQDFIAASKDSAAQMRELVTNSIKSLNDQLVRAMSGQKTSFSNMGAGIFRSVAGTALQKGEGAAMDATGLTGLMAKMGMTQGKLGTKSNPMYTKSADTKPSGMGGAGTSDANPLSAVFGASGGASADDAAGGGIATIPSVLTDLIPGFADGGYMNGPSIVGENGPEIFTPAALGGHVTPNHKLTATGGGIHFHAGAIDATSSTDPAQTAAQVHQAVMAVAPHIINASMKASAEHAKRRASSAR